MSIRLPATASALLIGLAACAGNAALRPATASLPLPTGYYVASDTACGAASNATTVLLGRGGMGGARKFCEFRNVEQISQETYLVTHACRALQGDAPAQVVTVRYTLQGDAAFTSRSDSGWQHDARYCAQPELPEPFRTNDISDRDTEPSR